jgi:hypothetical protein
MGAAEQPSMAPTETPQQAPDDLQMLLDEQARRQQQGQ